MSEPYIGEIRLFAGNFAPVNWAFPNGTLFSISQNEALFNLIGTTYGGDGQSTFALPDLQGRIPVHQGQGIGLSQRVMGQVGGVESASLHATQLPSSPASPIPAAVGFRPQVQTVSPFLAVSFILSLFGVFPSQN
jgi:microcystin-dependent protein